VVVRIAAAAVVVRRLTVAVVVKAHIIEVATAAGAATSVVEVAAAGVGRLAVAAIVVVLDGNATSAFPDKCIQKRSDGAVSESQDFNVGESRIG
jgi:hypothetical protein